MKEELARQLLDKYPWMEPSDGFGIGVGDGWYNILNCIGAFVKNAVEFENSCIKKYKEKPDGFTWKPRDKEFSFPEVQQIKEKFGGLRFYFSMDTKQLRYEVRGFVDGMESISFTICEDCGNKGEVRKGSWIKTMCDKCYINYNKRVSKRFGKLREMEIKNEIARSKK